MKAKHVVTIPIEEARALRDVAMGTGGAAALGKRVNTLRRAVRRVSRAMTIAEKNGWRPS